MDGVPHFEEILRRFQEKTYIDYMLKINELEKKYRAGLIGGKDDGTSNTER